MMFLKKPSPRACPEVWLAKQYAMLTRSRHKAAMTIIFIVLLISCSTKPERPVINYTHEDMIYMDQYSELAPNNAKIGKDYQVGSDWYFPMHDPSYDKTGIASWYGPGMIGGRTANGEAFDSKDFTAAHPSLPIPTIVEVTNLDNGKKVNVRINDRGPFHSKRIIDLSKPAATALDMIKTGTAHVRVRVLERETLDYMQYAYNSKPVQQETNRGNEMTQEQFWTHIK